MNKFAQKRIYFHKIKIKLILNKTHAHVNI